MDEVVVLTAFFDELEKIAGKYGPGAGSDLWFSALKRKGKELMKGRTEVAKKIRLGHGKYKRRAEVPVDPSGKGRWSAKTQKPDSAGETLRTRQYAPKEGLSSADLAKYYTGRALRSAGKGGEKVERFARDNPGTAAALGLGTVGTGVAAASLLKDDR